jgi:hypothetical protein
MFHFLKAFVGIVINIGPYVANRKRILPCTFDKIKPFPPILIFMLIVVAFIPVYL